MGNNNSLDSWDDVPDRSTLEVSVESENPDFASSARFVSDDGRVENWTDAELHPGPKRRMLSQTAQGYVGTVLIAFDGDDPAPVNVSARILDSQGTVVGNAVSHSVTGQRGDISSATLLVSMEEP
jgi:hypothetical protein